jgi:hypothetical protein
MLLQHSSFTHSSSSAVPRTTVLYPLLSRTRTVPNSRAVFHKTFYSTQFSSVELVHEAQFLVLFCLRHEQFWIPCCLPKMFYSTRFLYFNTCTNSSNPIIPNRLPKTSGNTQVRLVMESSAQMWQLYQAHTCYKSLCKRLLLRNSVYTHRIRVPWNRVTLGGTFPGSYHTLLCSQWILNADWILYSNLLALITVMNILYVTRSNTMSHASRNDLGQFTWPDKHVQQHTGQCRCRGYPVHTQTLLAGPLMPIHNHTARAPHMHSWHTGHLMFRNVPSWPDISTQFVHNTHHDSTYALQHYKNSTQKK